VVKGYDALVDIEYLPLIPFYVMVGDKTSEHVWDGTAGESDGESALFVDRVFLGL